MNKTIVTGMVIGVIAASAGASFAGFKMLGRQHPAYAQVVDIVEVRERVQAGRLDCRQAPLSRRQLPPDALQPMARGNGSEQRAATVASGHGDAGLQRSLPGDNTRNAHRRCEMVGDAREIVVAYDVTYRVGDERGTVRMDHRPAEHIRIEDGELLVDASIAGRR